MYGIEIEPIAHALASIVVWIGYIQWRTNNAYSDTIREPILEELKGHIVCKDAILAFDDEGNPTEPQWPAVDVIVGNPPIVGGKKKRRALADNEIDNYLDLLFQLYPELHGEADLSTYWFEKSLSQLKASFVNRVGLLTTNKVRSIRNRPVLDHIKDFGDIFMAWSNRLWEQDGAELRVAMVGFDDGEERIKVLDGETVEQINSDLTSTIDITAAASLAENAELSFMGLTPTGKFQVDSVAAVKMLNAQNPTTFRRNSDVLRHYVNAKDITDRDRSNCIVDFTGLDLHEAIQYELPIEHVRTAVKPFRDDHNNKKLQNKWWLFEAPRQGMVSAISSLSRQLISPLSAKHRFFVWYPVQSRAANTAVAIARDDDYMFGILHSSAHTLWALRKCGWLGVGDHPRYTNTTTFETFPFPRPPGSEDASHPAHIRISRAAKQLHEERDAWLNPAGMSDKQLKDRTLTNLYNALQVFRGRTASSSSRQPPISRHASPNFIGR